MITIKGLREGLLIVFDEESWLVQLRGLANKLDANATFFKGGQVALDVKSLSLSIDDIKQAQQLLLQYDVTLWAVFSLNETTNRNTRALGLPDNLEAARVLVAKANGHAPEDSDSSNAVEGTDGLLVRRRVRSGQVLRHPGHIVVIGDVNPGAQIIAGGDIIVWGKLQGLAHAGALGASDAIVCALELAPSLLRIGDVVRAAGSMSRRVKSSRPEMAMVDQQEINIVAWMGR